MNTATAQVCRRVLDLSFQHQIGHVSSNLAAAQVLAPIYQRANPETIVILSAGHCGLALYCCLEQFCAGSADYLLKTHGEQPHLDPAHGIHCTSGSLGQALTLAMGYALADRTRAVEVVISDGECAEGCVWEALAFADKARLDNLTVHVIANGYCALAAVDLAKLDARLKSFLPAVQMHRVANALVPHGIHSHYKTLTQPTYEEAIRRLAA